MTDRDSTPATPAQIRDAVLRHVRYSLGKQWEELSPRELLEAVSLAVRDHIVDGMLATEHRWRSEERKRVYYLSMEFLMGRSLSNNLHNLGLYDVCKEAMLQLGVDLEEVAETEVDAALGNGGLGRLAACFLDSMATLGIPGQGYGINYEYGLFRQAIDNGWQKEKPDNWMALGSPWQFERRDDAVVVPLYGHIEHFEDLDASAWMGWEVLVGVPHDMPVVGSGGDVVNALRLYSARASEEFDISIFNSGDYVKAVQVKMESETVSKILYPPDSDERGRELRLVQEYFFTSCAIQDIVKTFLRDNGDIARFADKVAIQLNDTHPALGVAELMRVLMDEHGQEWDQAWAVTRDTFAYTNHTLLPEALERWPRSLLERVLPRHMQIIEAIDVRFLDEVERKWPGDGERKQRMSIIDSSTRDAEVRMAHLAIVGSHSVNGVAKLHSELVKSDLVPDFHALWPERFNNKTNGVTQRRWLQGCNPGLTSLITETIGDGWITDMTRLRDLEPHAQDAGFREAFEGVKRGNKERLARMVADTCRVTIDPAGSLFDVQAKRIHEYKRQLLMALGIIHDYLALVDDGVTPGAPRTYLFAGKAAPGYWAAKQHIKLINSIAHTVNNDPRVGDWMRVAFVPDYRVSVAETMIPAADLSEQISTAGMEASGTGNMKFAMNGALTIGTLDGANIEIRQEVGEENIFIFGHTAEEIATMRTHESYDPMGIYEGSEAVRRVLDSLEGERFCPGDGTIFKWIKESLLQGGDYFFHLADFEGYVDTQARVSRTYRESDEWVSRAILNVARMGVFSSDRTIAEYARDIWGVPVAATAPAPQRAPVHG